MAVANVTNVANVKDVIKFEGISVHYIKGREEEGTSYLGACPNFTAYWELDPKAGIKGFPFFESQGPNPN